MFAEACGGGLFRVKAGQRRRGYWSISASLIAALSISPIPRRAIGSPTASSGSEMLDFGLSGWMADFGEYLPTDVRLFDGSDPMEAHNRWPVLWAKVNADAIATRGKTGEAVFFMRAGFSGVQAHCPLLWAGDQSVDFTRHDGIGTVLTAALSSGLVGNAWSAITMSAVIPACTAMCGPQELLHRWIDLGAFTPVMRSHEGNRPDDNLQIDHRPNCLPISRG